MSNPSETKVGFLVPSLSRRAVVVIAVCAALTVAAYWRFGDVADYLGIFNDRRGIIYPSAFTFLSILWAAALTIWGLLKSRATRYIERLADNVVFREFIRQYERRLVYSFVIIVFSFAVYIADLTVGLTAGLDEAVLTFWFWSYLASICLIFDSLFTARVVLD